MSALGEITEVEIREHVARLISSSAFKKSKRSNRLLHFLVEHALSGQAEDVKEYVLAVEVFDRDGRFVRASQPVYSPETGFAGYAPEG